MKEELFNKILLVEDDDAHATLVARNLNKYLPNGKIHRVSNGEEALNYLFERSEIEFYSQPTLILLDLRLPRIGGLEVLREIKKHPRLKKIPTVVLTSSEAKPDVDKAYEYNVNSYVVKPLDFSRFSELLKDLSVYWNSWNTTLKLAQN